MCRANEVGFGLPIYNFINKKVLLLQTSKKTNMALRNQEGHDSHVCC